MLKNLVFQCLLLLKGFSKKRQRNFCTTLIKKIKRNFYNNLNVNKITNNKSFWKIVKPSFTEKALKDEEIVLTENDTTFLEENKIAEIFRSYFDGIVGGLNSDAKCDQND